MPKKRPPTKPPTRPNSRSVLPFKGAPRGRPFQPGQGKPPGSGRKKGVGNAVTKEIREFFREFVESPQYQENVKTRILEGRAATIEALGLQWVGGKPVEVLQVETETIDKLAAIAAAHGLRD